MTAGGNWVVKVFAIWSEGVILIRMSIRKDLETGGSCCFVSLVGVDNKVRLANSVLRPTQHSRREREWSVVMKSYHWSPLRDCKSPPSSGDLVIRQQIPNAPDKAP